MRELVFSDVSLAYKAADGSFVQALSHVELSVGQGEPVALIGPSGCGKSSTLQLACGLLAPSSGMVEVDGKPLTCPRSSTALILQDFGLLPWKTVIANAELGLKFRGVSKAERRERAREALALVGLSGLDERYPDELSGGQAQRLALARSLALDVDLLLMDEPLSALDALLREQLQDTLLDLWRSEGYAQLLVTHSIEEAVYLGRRILIMSSRPGRIVGIVDNPDMGTHDYRSGDAYASQVRLVRELLRESGSRAGEGACIEGRAGEGACIEGRAGEGACAGEATAGRVAAGAGASEPEARHA